MSDEHFLVDSSAALAVTNRKGNGKLRPVRIGQLWVQQLAEEPDITFKKVKGDDNPADVCTKHLVLQKLEKLMTHMCLEHREGRADSGLKA